MSRSRTVATTAASLLLAAGLLGACGGDGDEESGPQETPSATPTASQSPTAVETPEARKVKFGKPAKGTRIKGSTYTFRVPDGWLDNTASAREVDSEIDASGAESDGADGFRNNVTVTSIVATGGNLDDLEADITLQLENVAKKISQEERVMLAGRPMAHHVGVLKGNPPYHVEQYSGIDEEGRVTVIAFNFAHNTPAKARERSTNAILASWKW